MDTNSNTISWNDTDEYAKYIRTYRKDEAIMVEGEESDNSLHLIRQGSVGVYRKVDNQDALIDVIEAENFVGELEVINGGLRMGTVRVLSDSLTTYRFLRSDLQTLVHNPYWGELLVLRLSKDLIYFSNQFVKNEASISRLLDEKEAVLQNMKDLLLTINEVLNSIVRNRSFPVQDQEALLALISMIQKYLVLKLPETYFHVDNGTSPNYRKLYEENLIPEKLAKILMKSP